MSGIYKLVSLSDILILGFYFGGNEIVERFYLLNEEFSYLSTSEKNPDFSVKFLSLEKKPSNKRVNNVIMSIRIKLSNQPLKHLNQDLLNFINF